MIKSGAPNVEKILKELDLFLCQFLAFFGDFLIKISKFNGFLLKLEGVGFEIYTFLLKMVKN